MGLTDDRNDPDLGHGVDEKPGQMNVKYLVLSEEERAKEFVRPLRHRYVHLGVAFDARVAAAELQRELDGETITLPDLMERAKKLASSDTCGCVTWMNAAIAETYARNPSFYGATWCARCSMHRPLTEFLWVEEGTDRIVPMVVGA